MTKKYTPQVNRRAIALTLALLLAMAILAGCGNDSALVGKWEHSSMSYSFETNAMDVNSHTVEFRENGTGTYTYSDGETRDFEWETSGSQLILTYESGRSTEESYEVSDGGNQLEIGDTTYTKA